MILNLIDTFSILILYGSFRAGHTTKGGIKKKWFLYEETFSIF